MRELALLTFLTLDGVMQAPSVPEEDLSGGFGHGGWARPCWDDVMPQVMRVAMNEPYDLVLGRTTYDLFASNFPNAPEDNPVARKLNAATKHVVTSSDGLTWANSQRIEGNVVDEITKLKAADGPLLQVHGSWQLAQTLIANHLVDEYRLWTFPVIVGSGKRLFGENIDRSTLTLVEAEPGPSGALMHIYRSPGRDAG
ncbi:MAG: dihydrofolate reductase family protein [Planctomycetota bacterium]